MQRLPTFAENYEPSSKVQLFISGRKLKDLDVFSKSDPLCKVFIRTGTAQNWTPLGQTETIDNNLNPDFATSFTVEYFFEKEQHLKFEMYDEDVQSLEHIGNCEVKLGKIVGSQKQTFLGELTLPGKSASRGKLIVRADAIKETNNEIQMKVSCSALPDRGGCFCGGNNPFLTIYRARGGVAGEWLKVHVTEVINGTQTPAWNHFKRPMGLICNSERELPIKLEVSAFRGNGNHQLYGWCETTVQQIIDGEKKHQLRDAHGNPAGFLSVNNF